MRTPGWELRERVLAHWVSIRDPPVLVFGRPVSTSTAPRAPTRSVCSDGGPCTRPALFIDNQISRSRRKHLQRFQTSVPAPARSIPPAIRRALMARDPRCQFPGCTARRCDAHHLTHWAHDAPTSLDNLVHLCRWHHRAVHEGVIASRVTAWESCTSCALMEGLCPTCRRHPLEAKDSQMTRSHQPRPVSTHRAPSSARGPRRPSGTGIVSTWVGRSMCCVGGPSVGP